MEIDVLTPEIMATMPEGLSTKDRILWEREQRKKLLSSKIADIDAKNKPVTGSSSDNDNIIQAANVSSNTDVIETVIEPLAQNDADNRPMQDDDDKPSIEQAKEIDSSIDNVMAPEINKISGSDSAPVKKKKPMRKNDKNFSSDKDTKRINDSAKNEIVMVKGVPKSIVLASRQLFPNATSAAAAISAMVYLFYTQERGGGLDVPEKIIELAENYESEDRISEIIERLGIINNHISDQTNLIYATMICACYDAYDRLYGARERRKSPKDTEFREQGMLDMLSRLRQQAMDQKRSDSIDKGREINNSIKDRYDKK